MPARKHWVLELTNWRRHHLHDVETLLFQFLQEIGQGGHGCAVDVVEQSNAFAARLKPFESQHDDFFRRNTRMPVIRLGVGARLNERPCRKFAAIRSECANPGTRKNGATSVGSPNAVPTSIIPLSISHSTNGRVICRTAKDDLRCECLWCDLLRRCGTVTGYA